MGDLSVVGIQKKKSVSSDSIPHLLAFYVNMHNALSVLVLTCARGELLR